MGIRTFEFAGREIHLETGAVARRALGAVVVRSGSAVLMGTVVASNDRRPGIDFFPLTVEYREKSAAAGRIPGSFMRREGKISDREVVISRLIDRSIRPLFPKEYQCEVQVQVQVLSADPRDLEPEALAILAASAALHLSPVPWNGPVAGMPLACCSGDVVPLAGPQVRRTADVDLVVSSARGGLVMIEGSAQIATEEAILSVLKAAGAVLEPVLDELDQFREEEGVEKLPLMPREGGTESLRERLAAPLGEALAITDRSSRQTRLGEVMQSLADPHTGRIEPSVRSAALDLEYELVRERMAAGHRLDGRGATDIRPVTCRAGWLPAPHGSALFTRGQTQASVTATLASQSSEQSIETLGGMERRGFLLHYNFPGYSVGEVRPLRGPGRREVGHGALARRALLPVLPPPKEFPFVIRVESDILESNGSSSMATICGASLALMDAGVPVRGAVAGIAMGLVCVGGETQVLSDILGDEDHLGDMDFKVAGTRDGITALQLDNKMGSLSMDVLARALVQAREGRLAILDAMDGELASPREDGAGSDSRVERLAVPKDAIGLVIGPKGSTIRGLRDTFGVEIEVDDHGDVTITGSSATAASDAAEKIRGMIGSVELGKLYEGRVVKVMRAGAVLRVGDHAEGWLHVSDWDTEGVRSMEDVTRTGDDVLVRVVGVDGRGRMRLSRKAALDRGQEPVANSES